MKNWNPSRAPNAIAIRNLSKFAGRHYCRWLTKRGIGTIFWVRFDRQETHSECSRDPFDSLSIRWPHLSPFFSFFLFFLFSHDFLYSPVKFITTRCNNRALSCFTQRRFTFLRPWEMATGNGGGGAPISSIFAFQSFTFRFFPIRR